MSARDISSAKDSASEKGTDPLVVSRGDLQSAASSRSAAHTRGDDREDMGTDPLSLKELQGAIEEADV